MSHLQTFISQKEFSNRALQQGYTGQAGQPSVSQYTPPTQAWSAYPGYSSEMSLPKSADPYSSVGPDMLPYFSPIAPPSAPVTTAPVSTSVTSSSSAPQTQPSLTTLMSQADPWTMNNQFHNGHHFSAFTSAGHIHTQNLNAYGKPYRPWGRAEMASC